MPDTTPPLTDAQAVRRVLDGDTGAFAVLVERYSPAVFALLARYFPLCEQEELAQDSFVQAFEQLHNLGTPESFPAWLKALTLRRCAKHRRKAANRREVSMEGSSGDDLCSWLHGCLLEESRQRREDDVRQQENKSLLARLMSHLKPEDRTALGLFYAMDHKLSEIAGMLGWSEVKVKVRLHRAKKSMALRMRTLPFEEYAGF